VSINSRRITFICLRTHLNFEVKIGIAFIYRHELDCFPVFTDVSVEDRNDINASDFLILHNETCQHLEVLCNSLPLSNQMTNTAK
jgi:hypothetical protein